MLRAIPFCLALLAAGVSQLRAQESEFYKKPETVAEFWRALTFELSVGKYEVAASLLKGMLAMEPKDEDLLAIEEKDGLVAFLRLRNVERWSKEKPVENEARDNTEKLIVMASAALKKQLSDPVRITKFARNLIATPEESAFAIKELLRSGIEAIPVLLDLLRGDSPPALRAAILELLPRFDINVVPPLVAALDVNEVPLKLELLDALRKRPDYLAFAARADTDLTPYLWYFSAPLVKNPGMLREKAQDMLKGLVGHDAASVRFPEQRTPQYRLAQFTREFLEHKAKFDPNTPQPVVWKWDGAKLVATPMSVADAEEYYGLRYGKWALEIQPEYLEAQKAFLTLALEKHFARAGADQPLIKSSPSLYAILAAAPYELLTELAETYMRERRMALAVALLQVIGDRNEKRAARPSDPAPAKTDFRPSLLMKALDFPDRQVRFAAVEALLKTPNSQAQLRSAVIVKVLTGFLQAEMGEDGAKPRAVIGDPDQARAQMLAGIMRQAGYNVETLRTGREVIRRLQNQADVDLVVLDRHLPYPMMGDTLAQLRADLRTRSLPLLIVASPDQLTTAHPITLLGRLSALVAAEEHIEFRRSQQAYDDPRRDLPSNRFKRRQELLRKLVSSAGIPVTPAVEDRLEYLTLLGTSADIPLPSDLELSRLIIPSPDREVRIQSLRNDPKRGHIAIGESPFSNTRDLTPALALILARYELALPPETLDLGKFYWQAIQNGVRAKDNRVLLEGLPDVAMRHPDIEAKMKSLTKGFERTRVIPEAFTPQGFKEEIKDFVTLQEPKVREVERKGQAKAALEWLRKMAVGELSGYPVADAEQALRQTLQNPELAPLAIDAIVQLPSKESQQDIASVILGPLAPEIRAQAVDALIRHIQQRGRLISDAQSTLLFEKTAAEADPTVKAKLTALRGILEPSAASTGKQLLEFTPGPVPELKKEEPKN